MHCRKTKNPPYSRLKKYLNFSLLLSLSINITSIANANNDYPNWSVKGFGTLGLARSDNDSLGFYRDRAQTREVKKSFEISTDSRLGLQLDVDINDEWHATTQFIVRDHAGDFVEQNLDWAFLRWQPTDTTTIRAGRMGLDAFLLSDYRNVGYAYPWMRPSHEFYANIPITHYDGMDFKHTLFLENGDDLAFKVSAGYSSTSHPEEFTNFKLEGPVVTANLLYQTGNWRLRAGYVYIWQLVQAEGRLPDELRATLNNPAYNYLVPNLNKLRPLTDTDNGRVQFMSIGTAYDNGTWLMHAEASYTEEEDMRMAVADTVSAYFSIGRRFSDLTVYSVYGVSQSFPHKIDTLSINPELANTPLEAAATKLSGAVTDIFNNQSSQHIDQQSISLGLRWDFYQNVAFKAQWTHFWLGEHGAPLWQRDRGKHTPNRVNLFSFGFDFIF
jgi:hypothetical protein